MEGVCGNAIHSTPHCQVQVQLEFEKVARLNGGEIIVAALKVGHDVGAAAAHVHLLNFLPRTFVVNQVEEHVAILNVDCIEEVGVNLVVVM